MVTVKSAKVVKVTAKTELPDLLDEAAAGPLILDRDGERFELRRAEARQADTGPKTVAESLQRHAGFITPEEAEQMIEVIYRAREEGSRPLDRP